MSRTGFEPATESCNHNNLTDQAHKEAHNLWSDPVLAHLVTAWPVLSEERKRIIASLLSSPTD